MTMLARNSSSGLLYRGPTNGRLCRGCCGWGGIGECGGIDRCSDLRVTVTDCYKADEEDATHITHYYLSVLDNASYILAPLQLPNCTHYAYEWNKGTKDSCSDNLFGDYYLKSPYTLLEAGYAPANRVNINMVPVYTGPDITHVKFTVNYDFYWDYWTSGGGCLGGAWYDDYGTPGIPWAAELEKTFSLPSINIYPPALQTYVLSETDATGSIFMDTITVTIMTPSRIVTF